MRYFSFIGILKPSHENAMHVRVVPCSIHDELGPRLWAYREQLAVMMAACCYLPDQDPFTGDYRALHRDVPLQTKHPRVPEKASDFAPPDMHMCLLPP